jgi:hypothetical protein
MSADPRIWYGNADVGAQLEDLQRRHRIAADLIATIYDEIAQTAAGLDLAQLDSAAGAASLQNKTRIAANIARDLDRLLEIAITNAYGG